MHHRMMSQDSYVNIATGHSMSLVNNGLCYDTQLPFNGIELC